MTKKIFASCLLVCLFVLPQIASAQGINFEHDLAWKDLLTKAAKENKIVFMDAYTTWCGPCKKMARETFMQPDVANLFNAKFVNAKIDMEKGEGIALSQTYNVRAYPTLLFINPTDGAIVHQAVGYHDGEQFLQLANDALDPSKQIGVLNMRYDRGDRNPEFLFGYAYAAREAMTGTHGKIADEYLKTQKDWASERNSKFLFDMATDANSPMFQYILDNRERFETLYSKDMVNQKIETLLYNKLDDPNASLDEIQAVLKKTNPENAERTFNNYKMVYYRNRGDRANYAKSAVSYFKAYSDSAEELNEAAWTFYEVIEDKSMLKKAVKWAKKSIKLDNQYFNNDTLAALYYKLGKKSKALAAAETAI
ncbi:MAG: thioredoxin fold domain-containing protein, partial [Saprospiraceae bacterium]